MIDIDISSILYVGVKLFFLKMYIECTLLTMKRFEIFRLCLIRCACFWLCHHVFLKVSSRKWSFIVWLPAWLLGAA